MLWCRSLMGTALFYFRKYPYIRVDIYYEKGYNKYAKPNALSFRAHIIIGILTSGYNLGRIISLSSFTKKPLVDNVNRFSSFTRKVYVLRAVLVFGGGIFFCSNGGNLA